MFDFFLIISLLIRFAKIKMKIKRKNIVVARLMRKLLSTVALAAASLFGGGSEHTMLYNSLAVIVRFVFSLVMLGKLDECRS